jgi:hypothetical protein
LGSRASRFGEKLAQGGHRLPRDLRRQLLVHQLRQPSGEIGRRDRPQESQYVERVP